MNDTRTEKILHNFIRTVGTALLNPIHTDRESLYAIQVAWLDATEAMMNCSNCSNCSNSNNFHNLQPLEPSLEVKLRDLEYRFVQHMIHEHKP
jgi:hypothetical protein